MMAIVGNRTMTDDVLSTIMCLVEQTLNSRSLISVSVDPDESESLTTNHFLLGRESQQLYSFLTISDIPICGEHSEYHKHMHIRSGVDGKKYLPELIDRSQ